MTHLFLPRRIGSIQQCIETNCTDRQLPTLANIDLNVLRVTIMLFQRASWYRKSKTKHHEL